MEDVIHILIVGHDLQAKCDVANALIKRKQKHGFKQFLCRQNLLIKKTVGTKETDTEGQQMNITLTPNLNTPAWDELTDKLRRFSQKIFIYVQTKGHVNVNDSKSIERLRKTFGVPFVQVIEYFENEDDINMQKLENITIHAKMSLKERTLKVYSALSESCSRLKANPFHRNKLNMLGFIDEMNEDRNYERSKTEDLDLPDNIEDIEWDLLNSTLIHGRAKSNHVRVNFIGNQGAGKTTLVSRLHGLKVKCPDEKLKPTEALEIKQLTSRCTEVDGKKYWETNIDGYKDDLNVQRMTQAMKSVQTYSERNVEADITVESTDDEKGADLYEPRSYTATENYPHKSYQTGSFPSIKNDQSRVQYMKRILRKKNHSRGERMYVSYWDFAGQSTYYSTHQLFMSQSAVYVLVVNLNLNFNEKLSDSLKFRTGMMKDCSIAESLIFWISSIKAFTADAKGTNAPVLIVGTHIDKVKDDAVRDKLDPEEVISQKFDDIRDILKMSEVECIAIDNADPDKSDLQALRNRILELGLGVIDEEIPAQWIDLERKIQEHKNEKTWTLTFSDLKRLDEEMDVPIRDNTRLEAFLGHQHNRGHLIYFLHDKLKDMIILEPNLLAKFLNNLMRTRENEHLKKMKQHTSMYNHNGIINQSYVTEVAKMFQKYTGADDIDTKLLNMLVHLSVVRPYKFGGHEERYLLPCLLPDRLDKTIPKDIKNRKSFKVEFPHNHMPPTFYHIIVGALLSKWKPVEPTVEKPEIYNLYACFKLDKSTRQMEIFWKESSIYIDILSYSQGLTSDQIFEILETVEKSISEIFLVYRHTNTTYEIGVLCPKHKTSFVSLHSLKRDGEAMCYHSIERHAVDFESIFNRKLNIQKPLECYKRVPNDIDLGRLASYLVRETATSLAIRLRIHRALIEADRAAQKDSDENIRRLSILLCWKRNYGSETIGDLVHLLLMTGEYQKEDFQNLFEGFPKREKYEIPDEKLDIVPENKCDILAAAESVGVTYPLLMLELGLAFTDIENARANNQHDMRSIILTLLQQWRQQQPRKSTTRTLLDTARFVRIDTTLIREKVMRS